MHERPSQPSTRRPVVASARCSGRYKLSYLRGRVQPAAPRSPVVLLTMEVQAGDERMSTSSNDPRTACNDPDGRGDPGTRGAPHREQRRASAGGQLEEDATLTGPLQPLSVRLVLFLSSYSPLFTILAIRFEDVKLRLVMAGIATVGVLLLVLLLLSSRRAEPKRFMVSRVEDKGNDVAAYVATYLLPLIVLTVPTIPDLIGYAIFLAISAVVFVQSQMVVINPLVYMTGRRILLAHLDSGDSFYLINRRSIHKNEPIWTREILPGLSMRTRDHSRKVGGWG